MEFSTAWFTTNRTCNNNCKWCYAQKTLNRKNVMDIEKAKRLLNELKERNLKRVILIGGEPTIYPNFIELIKYIHENGIRVSVATNGRKFSDENFAKKVLEAGIDGIDISLKAISEEEYVENTNSKGLMEMLKGYKNLKKLGFRPTVSYVIVNNDYKKFDELVCFLERFDISPVSIQFVKPVLNSSEKIMDLKDMGDYVEVIYNRLNETNIDYYLEISFPLCLINEGVLEKLSHENRIINCCHVPSGSGIIFDEDFKIIPCNHFAEYPFSEKPISFSERDSIEKIMESDIAKEFRRMARCYPASKCESCNLWMQCGGGCFTRWLTLDPNDYIK